VAVALVFFFNTKLHPFLLCYKGKKKKAKQKKKKVTAAAVSFFVKLHCNAASEEEEEGDDNATPQHSRLLLLRCNAAPQQEEEGDGSSWNYAAAQLHSRKKKATAAVVAFFVELRYNCTTGRKRQRQVSSPSLWSCTIIAQ